MARGLVTAREQFSMLSPWRTAADVAPGATSPVDLAARLRDLNKRHMMNRIPESVPKGTTVPQLTPEEQAERAHLSNWSESLRGKWDNMEPMTPEEIQAHLHLNGPHSQRDPQTMDDHGKSAFYDEYHPYMEGKDRSQLTPRELHHMSGLQDWAEGYYGNMQNDAQDERDRVADYAYHGSHPGGAKTLEGLEDSHHPDLTGAWAAEAVNSGQHGAMIQNAAKDYVTALNDVADEGPHGMNVETGKYHHQSLSDARNAMRVELQHGAKFKVPTTAELSPIVTHDPADESVGAGHVNPRYHLGLPGRSEGAREAYKVNCQRATLAQEARMRGHNVEARPNYKHRGSRASQFSDKAFDDHDIASWFHDPADASQPTPSQWTDPEDHPDLQGAPAGPHHWDHMHDQIASWGPGARGVIAFSHGTPGSYSRHIINTHVDRDGVPRYQDAQTADTDASHFRDSIVYGEHPQHQVARAAVANSPLKPGKSAIMSNNKNFSPLRYMRTDDKPLHPETSQYMVDRGTASDRMITPPPPSFYQGET